jgi:hypothetical protein
MKVKQAEGNGIWLKETYSSNPELFDVIDRLGALCILQQLTYSNGGLMKKAV